MCCTYSDDGKKIIEGCKRTLKFYTVREGTEVIGENAFCQRQSLFMIDFPKTLTHIEKKAFLECFSLEIVKLNDGLLEIGDEAFSACRNLKEIKLPNSLISIGQNVFPSTTKIISECFELRDSLFIDRQNNHLIKCLNNSTTIRLPDELVSIGRNAFSGCHQLQNLEVSLNKITYFKEQLETSGYSSLIKKLCVYDVGDAGRNYNEDDACIYSNDDKILVTARQISSEEYEVKPNVEVILKDAFCKCDSLKSIILPDSLEIIGFDAFPSGIEIKSNKFEIKSGLLINKQSKCLIQCLDRSKIISLPCDLKSVSEDAFSFNLDILFLSKGLEKINLSSNCCTKLCIPCGTRDHFETILRNNGGNQRLIECDFVTDEYGCLYSTNWETLLMISQGLKEYTVRDSIRKVKKNFLIANNEISKIFIPQGMYDSFWESLPNTWKKYELLENNRCKCEKIVSCSLELSQNSEEYEVKYGVDVIPDNSFSRCYSLKSVTLPSTVERIGAYAFSNCQMLDKISLPESVISIGEQAFPIGVKIESSSPKYIIENDLLIEDGKRLIQYLQDKTSFEIPGDIEVIGKEAFAWCYLLTEIHLSENLKRIENRAFAFCKSLKEIKLQSDIEIGSYNVFEGCESLETIFVPQGHLSYYENLFREMGSNYRVIKLKEIDK